MFVATLKDYAYCIGYIMLFIVAAIDFTVLADAPMKK